MNDLEFDALIIGTGIAGLSSALTLLEAGKKVCIITKAKDPNESNTNYAQGGIIYTNSDDVDLVTDIDNAAAKSSNKLASNELLNDSGKILEDILLNKIKVDFARDESGNLKFTREAAHSHKRIIYKGDYTGRSIQTAFLNYIKDPVRFPKLTLLTSHTAIDVLTADHNGKCFTQRYEPNKAVGAYVLDQESSEVKKIIAKTTILATGGIGSLYLHHSNSEGSRGDGHAMAKRVGAKLINMEFVQFHPTTFYSESAGDRRFLVSEAVRGEGGVLLNAAGVAFMKEYHPDGELAPRDVVSRSIIHETLKTAHSCVYLDISHKDSEWIISRFPTIYETCLKYGVDITKKPIPVVPAAHYSCGGVKTNLKGETTVRNLLAVGEVACTGLHGANRLASTSLLEGLTFGVKTAEHLLSYIDDLELYSSESIRDWENSGQNPADEDLLVQDWNTLKQTMWNYVGLVRTGDRLSRAEGMLSDLYSEINHFYRKAFLTDSLIGLRNAVETAYRILEASRKNKQSLGCFYRVDK